MITKQCTQCNKTFKLEDQDLAFYKKIDVPTPTLCPTCRFQRRLSWRNERTLYQDQCDHCQKSMLSLYAPNSPFTVYCHDCWWSDNFNPLQYGQTIDWSRPFFEQFKELQHKVPRINLLGGTNVENSEYTNDVIRIKDSYLVFNAGDVNHCLYCSSSERITDLVDCDYNSENVELCYGTTFSKACYNLRYAHHCNTCRDSAFLVDCRSCADCFMCVGLVNKQYCYKNKQFTEGEYKTIIQKYQLSQRSVVQNYHKEFADFAVTIPRKYYSGFANEHSTGDYLEHTAQVQHSFQTRRSEQCNYCYDVFGAKDCYDYTIWGDKTEQIYETICSGQQATRIFFSSTVYGGNEIYYCDSILNGAQSCFGSIGLKKEHYCILNTQYSEAEYKQLVIKLIEHMKKFGEYGEFFPAELSPFAYNESEAYEFYPLKQSEVIERGWNWQTALPGTYNQETLAILPDDIHEVDDAITKAVIVCKTCQRNFRFIPAEVDFYKRLIIPLPVECPTCRYRQRMQHRPSYDLYQRQCMCTQVDHDHQGRCTMEFETTYSPDRKELIYCEQCYQKEIY